MVPYFENRFPGWRKGVLVQVPEVQIQYAVTLAQEEKQIPVHGASDISPKEMQDVKIKEEYDQLVLKQRSYEGICKALNGTTFRSDSKAIFFQITRDRAEKALTSARLDENGCFNDERRSIAQIVSEFWKENLEFMSITSNHGIFIFQYANINSSIKVSMKAKAQLLQDLGEFSEECVTTIEIEVLDDGKCLNISKLEKEEYGFHCRISVTKSGILHDTK